MEQPTFQPTHRTSLERRVAPSCARSPRGRSGLPMRLFASFTLWVAGGVVLAPAAARAQETPDGGGAIVIPGPGEKNPAALADLAEHMQAAPARRVGSPATLAAATAQSLKANNSARDTDSFSRAANESGSIMIPGAGEPPAAPQMIRTSFKPDANGVVTIPAPAAAGLNAGNSANPASQGLTRVNLVPVAREVVPVVVTPATARQNANAQPVAANAPMSASAGIDTLASRGEPPQFGANGKPIVTRAPVVPAASSATTGTAASATSGQATSVVTPVQTANVRAIATRPVAPAVTQTAMRPAAVPQPAPLPGQQDPEAIRTAALAFLQQQSAGLPGKVDITVSPAFPRGLATCTALEPFMPSGARLWGRMTVGVRCAGERPWTIYLQARISLHATYYLAARAMSPGEVLTAADLVARDGDLTGLPQAIVTDPSQAVGSVTLTRVAGGMPLRRDMLKSASAVSIGQTVHVVAAGDGFAISAEGSAMNNASPGQQVRVKTANGQVISGIVKDGATVEIQL